MKNTQFIAIATLAVAATACERRKSEEGMPAPARDEMGSPRQEPKPGVQPAKPALEPRDPDEADDAAELVNDAAETLGEMKSDPKLVQLIKQARGVFIIPEFARVGAGVGVRGGEGVLLARQGGKWSSPGFYDIGGISVGPQLGVEGGDMAMLLMSDQALNSFKQDNNFSLNAGAKLTVVDYSEIARASSMGKEAGDVVFWSGTAGAFAGATLSATDIAWDDEENRAYYPNQRVTPGDIIGGKVKSPEGPLQRQLSGI